MKQAKREIVLGTGNSHKLKELTSLLKGTRIKVIPVTRFGKTPKVIENGRTFAANAMKKARVYSRLSNLLTLADDSGLCVKALRGAPGVYSARFAGPGCTYADNNRKLIRRLKGKPAHGRKAYFQSTIALYRKGKKVKLLTGKCPGTITEKIQGKNGFGYDPVFVPRGGKISFAQMSAARKNRLSHRGQALAKTKKFLRSYFS